MYKHETRKMKNKEILQTPVRETLLFFIAFAVRKIYVRIQPFHLVMVKCNEIIIKFWKNL